MRLGFALKFVFLSLVLGFSSQATELITVEEQLALSNSYQDLFGCAVVIKSTAQSANKVYAPTNEERASMDILVATFDSAFEIKGQAIGKVDISNHIPEFLSDTKNPEEYFKVRRSEHRYCLALHKIAVLERQLSYLNSGVGQ